MKKLSLMAALLAACFSAHAGWSTTIIGGAQSTYARGVSIGGSVIGGATVSGATPAVAFRTTDNGLQSLGALGSEGSDAHAVNASGQVVGATTNAAGAQVVFLYSNGAMQEIAAYPFWFTTTYINHIGQVAGSIGTTPESAVVNGFLYNRGALATITLGGDQTYVNGLNASGQVAGTGALPGSDRQHAFIYKDGAIADLGTLPGGTLSGAQSINDAGQLAGWATVSGDSALHAVRSADGALHDLGTLGGANSYAMAINESGRIVGYSDTAGGAIHAFVSDGEHMTDLGTLGGSQSYATGINGAGQIVGTSTTAGDSRAAPFLYENGVMYNLAELVTGFDSLLSDVYLNESGQIAGNGFINGQIYAFLLTYVPDNGQVGATATSSLSLATVGDADGTTARRRLGGKGHGKAVLAPPGAAVPQGATCPPPYCVPAVKKPRK